eukprot:2602896-Lingulodinium_polyedra.AAC.1
MRLKEYPGPPLWFYIAGPPCQPWARGGKMKGEHDPRAPLLGEVVNTIGRCRPLAVLMEESDRVASYLKGDRRARRVSELRALHYHVVWQI